MKYAEIQIARPRHEDHTDYGQGERLVLVRSSKLQRDLIFQRGYKGWTGVGMPWSQVPAELVLWKDTGKPRQQTLFEGAFSWKRLQEHIARIHEHFPGYDFNVRQVVRHATLLLDEGEETEVTQPPRPASDRPKPPVLGLKVLYRLEQSFNSDELRLHVFDVLREKRGQVLLKHRKSGRETKLTIKSVLDGDYRSTPELATEHFLRAYREDADQALKRQEEAAQRRQRCVAALSRAEQLVSDLLATQQVEPVGPER